MAKKSSIETFQGLYRDRLERARKERLIKDAGAKLDRAGEHLKTLKAEIADFQQADSHSIDAQTDPQTGAYLLRVQPNAVSSKISAIVGDVLCNFRPTLDYLVYALAYLDSGSPQEGTQFPICDSADYFKRKRKGWLKGLSPDHIAAIEDLQPYDGRDELQWLRTLRDLSNPDKHKHLSVVASAVEGVFEVLDTPKRILKSERTKGGGFKVDIRDWADLETIAERIEQRGKPKAEADGVRVSLPKGHVLEGADVHVQVGLTLQIAFDNGLPVRETLEEFGSNIEALLQTFEPEFQVA
jgi:hypothetical protein